MNINNDAYWTTEFTITEADLDRLAAFIDARGQAQPLSGLAKRVVSGRLRYGHEESTPVGQLFGVETSVKQWDPAAEWQKGDYVIALKKIKPSYRLVAIIGEVQDVIWNERGPEFSQVHIFKADENKVLEYGLLPAHSLKRKTIMANLKYEIARKREEHAGHTSTDSEAETVEITMYLHGERILGLLLQALGQDDRFVRLDGRYYLHSLTHPPTAPQLQQLTWALLTEADPLPTVDLLTRLPAIDEEDAALFGLYLALRKHPEWFANTQPGQRPLWTLAGPPPGSFTPHYAAYDPQSYEILCLPETEASPAVVARLWETELLTAVV